MYLVSCKWSPSREQGQCLFGQVQVTNLILSPDFAFMLSGVLDNTELVITDHFKVYDVCILDPMPLLSYC